MPRSCIDSLHYFEFDGSAGHTKAAGDNDQLHVRALTDVVDAVVGGSALVLTCIVGWSWFGFCRVKVEDLDWNCSSLLGGWTSFFSFFSQELVSEGWLPSQSGRTCVSIKSIK